MLNVINYVNHTSNKPIEYDLLSHLFKKLPRKKKNLDFKSSDGNLWSKSKLVQKVWNRDCGGVS